MKKHTKLSSAAFASIKSMATSVSQYDDTSPIWGKRLPEVLDNIQYEIEQEHPLSAIELIVELKKRLAKNAIIAQARHG